MKILSAILVLLFSHIITFGQTINDDDHFYNYDYDKNLVSIKKISTVSIERVDDYGKHYSKQIFYFNTQGVLTKLQIVDTLGITSSEVLFLVNKKTDLIFRKKIDHFYKTTDSIIYYKTYDGDKLIKDSSSQIPQSFNHIYNAKGTLVQTNIFSRFSSSGPIRRVIVYRLDSLERPVKIAEKYYQSENDTIGTLISNRSIVYNKYGKIDKEIELLNGSNSWMHNKGSSNFEYDKNGNLIKFHRTSGATYTYNYYENGLIASRWQSLQIDSGKFEIFDKYTYTFWK